MMSNQNETQRIDTLRKARGPLIVWLIMIGFVSMYVLSTSAFTTSARFSLVHQAQLVSHQNGSYTAHFLMALVVISLCGVILAVWIGPWLYQQRPWELICVPIVCVVIAIGIAPVSAPILMVGTYPILTIESIIAFRHPQVILSWITTIYILLWVIYFVIFGWQLAVIVIPLFIFVMAVVFYYWRFYQQQINESQRLESLYAELQLAYKQVEESAIRSERQRVARELHDTLTQGLAGVIMQLEAASSFLEQHQPQRAKKIIDTSVNTARATLQQSRITLTDLRSTTEESLPARLQLVTEAIRKNYQLKTALKLGDIPEYSASQLTEITRIVTEALTNVAKHANTQQALIASQLHDNVFKLKIIDFGAGFDQHTKPKIGHYGLKGLHERAARLGGVVTIVSSPGEGTTVTLTIPTTRKELDNHD